MVLDSSRQSCLIKVPRMISILCMTGSFILSVCLLIVETALGYHVIHIGWKRCVGNMNVIINVIATIDLDVLACSDGIHNWLIELLSGTSWVHHRYSCGQLKPTNWLSLEPDFLVKIWRQIWNWTGKRSSKMVFSCYSHAFWPHQNFEQNFWSILRLQMASDGWFLGLRLRQPHQGCRVVNTFEHSVVDHKN